MITNSIERPYSLNFNLGYCLARARQVLIIRSITIFHSSVSKEHVREGENARPNEQKPSRPFVTSTAGYLCVKSSEPSPKNKTSASFRAVDQIPRGTSSFEDSRSSTSAVSASRRRFESNSHRVGNFAECPENNGVEIRAHMGMHLFAAVVIPLTGDRKRV